MQDFPGDAAAHFGQQERGRVAYFLDRRGPPQGGIAFVPLQDVAELEAARVLMGPADIAFTRMPCFPRSAAR